MAIMEEFISLIGNSAFIQFISTFGLAVAIVVYFIFIRDPKHIKKLEETYEKLSESYKELKENYVKSEKAHDEFWEDKYTGLHNEYEKLNRNYDKLKEDYMKIEESLHAEKRIMSDEQARRLCYNALDRDLYKLYRYCCEKLDGTRVEGISVFMQDTILDTNDVWSKFTSPFPKVPCITDLYGVYINMGGKLKKELQEIMENADISDKNEKKDKIWIKLLDNTVNMKREFSYNLRKNEEGTEVQPYKEPEHGSEELQGS